MDQCFTKNITLLNDLKYLVSLDTSFHNVLYHVIMNVLFLYCILIKCIMSCNHRCIIFILYNHKYILCHVVMNVLFYVI